MLEKFQLKQLLYFRDIGPPKLVLFVEKIMPLANKYLRDKRFFKPELSGQSYDY
jgi:hypothetical protein